MPFRRGIVEEILERLEQKGAKPSASRVGMFQPITFQHHKKKILGEILCVLGRMAAAADERKYRPPIQAAELGQGLLRFLIVAGEIGRGKDKTPTRSREIARRAAVRGHTGVHGGG